MGLCCCVAESMWERRCSGERVPALAGEEGGIESVGVRV